jgi:hypothetical protein
MSVDNAESVPRPIEVGQEMAALRRFYRDSRWEGWIHEGGMGQHKCARPFQVRLVPSAQ